MNRDIPEIDYEIPRPGSASVDLTTAYGPAQYQGNMAVMGIVYSKLTAQGQISVPASIRRKLGVGPGSVLEWHEAKEGVVVRRAGRFTSQDVHEALFPEGPPRARSLEEMKAGVRRHVRKRHARD